MATSGNSMMSTINDTSTQQAAISASAGVVNGRETYTYTADGTLDTLFSDGTDLPYYQNIRGLYIGVAGNLKYTDWDGNTVGPIPVLAGAELSMRPRKIFLTGTTCSKVLGYR